MVVPPPAPIAEPTDATAGIFQHRVYQGLLALGHGSVGDILCRLGQTDDQPGVLLGKEALGDHDVEVAGQRDGAEHHHERHEAMSQHDLEASLVQVEQKIEPALGEAVEPSVLLGAAT